MRPIGSRPVLGNLAKRKGVSYEDANAERIASIRPSAWAISTASAPPARSCARPKRPSSPGRI